MIFSHLINFDNCFSTLCTELFGDDGCLINKITKDLWSSIVNELLLCALSMHKTVLQYKCYCLDFTVRTFRLGEKLSDSSSSSCGLLTWDPNPRSCLVSSITTWNNRFPFEMGCSWNVSGQEDRFPLFSLPHPISNLYFPL